MHLLLELIGILHILMLLISSPYIFCRFLLLLLFWVEGRCLVCFGFVLVLFCLS